MSPEEAITHWQCSLLLYDPGPSEMVPSEAPEEGEHEQLPEHVTIASLSALVYFPAAHNSHDSSRAAPPNEPGRHGLGSADPTEQLVPAGHSMHSSSRLLR